VPDGWQVIPKQKLFSFKEAGEKQQLSFNVKPLSKASMGILEVQAHVDEKMYNQQIIAIAYDHIGKHSVLIPAQAKLVRLEINRVPRKIGYIMGSGDDIPQALRQIGYTVDLLSDEDVALLDLTRYDVIICGVRAFNTRKSLQNGQDRLNAFVKQGGTWIVQHNTRFGFQAAQIGPYPFKATGRDRISQEEAPLQILMPEHPIFNYPNKITSRDFEGWVQERGLYFADSWEGKLYPLLAGKDTGEPAKLGGLLYARYGKGIFIYTAYSWFRQLPAGVPGAYRLFVNMISAEVKK
jgi:hypothetical protein